MEKYGKDEKDGKYLTTAEVADLLGLTRVTIRNYRVRGLLPATAAHRGLRPVYRFHVDDVIEFAPRIGVVITADDLSRIKGSSHEKDDR